MNKILFVIMAATLLAVSCRKAEEMRYDSHDNIYFDFSGSQRDSMLYTFAYEPSRAADTLGVPVRISGIRQPIARTFKVKILQDSSTAVPGKHYKALQDTYAMPANTGFVNVPVIIYNTDKELEERSVMLRFVLEATSDFGVAIPTLINGKIVFSSKLERPGWWGMWFGDYYSRVKHQIFLITTDQLSLSTEGLDAPKNLYFVGLVNTFLSDPAKWVSKNPAKGYVLEKRTDGNFDFYNTANPTKKMLYKKNEQANKFFFIDENNKEIQ